MRKRELIRREKTVATFICSLSLGSQSYNLSTTSVSGGDEKYPFSLLCGREILCSSPYLNFTAQLLKLCDPRSFKLLAGVKTNTMFSELLT